MEVGTRIKVFKERCGDMYHKKGDWKTGVILKEYSNYYLVLLEDKYKECFFKSEVFGINEVVEPRQEENI